MSRQRVVITGLGGLCAIGTDADSIWQSMCAGRCGLGPLTIDRRDLRTNIGGEIGAIAEDGIDPRRRVTMGRFSVLAVLAAGEALAASGLDLRTADPKRIGAVIGVAIWGADAVDESYRDIFLEGKKRTNIFAVPRAMPSAPAGQVSMQYGLRGPVFGVTSACSSSNHAILAAIDQLRLGRADIMLAGGTDTPMQYGILKVWETLRVLARQSCRPFSADRDGLVLADGAGVAVLETWEHATARNAPILAEIVGCGMSADAGDIVSPSVEGPVAAMQACLNDAELPATAIDYINAHGTATKANDRIETQAIRAVFGDHADKLAVSSTKSMHGHCLGASGAIELIACVNAIRHGIVPPTIGYTTPDPECDLEITANVAQERPVNVAISNAFAFGGLNAVIAVRKV
ncbi:MAG: beta-ketoacyl-[acyl-carrier-protein] synthase family protein [Alphaproteobacteria bacterium]|nr:MAG: beta-ketoacyl-[acyl-carrier-protein] synthase family protein [Alphaproteobacteria bacterium]